MSLKSAVRRREPGIFGTPPLQKAEASYGFSSRRGAIFGRSPFLFAKPTIQRGLGIRHSGPKAWPSCCRDLVLCLGTGVLSRARLPQWLATTNTDARTHARTRTHIQTCSNEFGRSGGVGRSGLQIGMLPAPPKALIEKFSSRQVGPQLGRQFTWK